MKIKKKYNNKGKEKRFRLSCYVKQITKDVLKKASEIKKGSIGDCVDQAVQKTFYSNIELILKEQARLGNEITKLSKLLEDYDKKDIQVVKDRIYNEKDD